MPKQLTEEISQPNNFTTGHTRCNVFGLSGAQSHRLLLPAHPWDRSRTKIEAASRCALRSTTLPAQSASVYPRSIKLPAVYLSPWFIVPWRYLNRFLALTQWMWWGSTICWLKVFTAKHTSGWVFTKNIRAPTSWWYLVGFASTGPTVLPLDFLN